MCALAIFQATDFQISTTANTSEMGMYTHTFSLPDNRFAKSAVRAREQYVKWQAGAESRREKAELQRQNDLFALSTHGYEGDLAEKALAVAEKYGIPVNVLMRAAHSQATSELGNLGYVADSATKVADNVANRTRSDVAKNRRKMAKASRMRNRRG